MTVECDGNGNESQLQAWLNNNGGATASDACGDVRFENNFNGLSDDCGATGSTTVTFTAIDDCGNESTTTATFTIEDTTNPSIDVSASDMTVECDGNGNQSQLQAWLDNNGGTQASDVCSGVTFVNDFTSVSNDCGATGSTTVTFTVIDDCGNESSSTATFTIEDTTIPVITCNPDDLQIECAGAASNEDQAEQWNTDNINALIACTTDAVSYTHLTLPTICSV